MLNTKLRRTALVSLVVVLMLSVFAMTAFAEGEDLITSTNAGESVDIATAPEADVSDLEVGTAVADEEVKAEDATKVEASDATDATTTGTVTEEEHDHDHEEEATADEGFTTSDLVLLIIFGVAVIVCAILCIIKREKVGKFLRGLKSEFKKIVWSPWNQVKKNVIVVIVVVIVLAVVIGLLDFLFGHGITELKKIINP